MQIKESTDNPMPKSPVNSKRTAVFFTILAGVLWGTSFPIIKIGLDTIDPYTFVFWRFLVSAFALTLVMLAFGKLKLGKMPDKKLLFFLGAVNAAGYLLQYVGMPYTTAAKAALFINLSAMWVAILSPKLLGESFSHKKTVGVILGFLGIIFVSTNLDFAALTEGQIAGDVLLIISGMSWAVFMIYNKKLVMNSTAETFQSMTWVLLFTFITIIPFTLLAGPGFFDIPLIAWAGIFWTAIVCWVIPYYLWLEGLKYLSSSVASMLLLSEIVMAVILSIVILKEPITVFSTIGALLIVIAIAIVSMQDKRKLKSH